MVTGLSLAPSPNASISSSEDGDAALTIWRADGERQTGDTRGCKRKAGKAKMTRKQGSLSGLTPASWQGGREQPAAPGGPSC